MESSSRTENVNSPESVLGGGFVGRQPEMGELKAALEEALSGRGRLVALVGEPGIGKTRTAQELAVYAGLRGAQVLWGRCYEEQGMPPYWPWVQAIRSYVRERDPERLRSEMGAGAADIAQVVSEVKERFPDLAPPPALDSPEQARFRMFDSITAFLKTAARQQPLVLFLDDLHWADQPSLLLLQFVVSELSTGGRLLLVGAYRDVELSRQHPLAETLGVLTRERLFQRVLLRGLGQEDVGRFIEVATGFGPPAELVRLVYAETEGNPLFVTEVVRLLVQEGELSPSKARGRDSWSVRIPEGVREVIGRRLNRLSQRCNETLTMASVLGREFELRQLRPLAEDMSEDRLLEVLEEALAARVIEELPRSMGRYQFTHALIQETLMSELSLTRRVRLHARIAQELEKLYGAQAEAHAAELAHHYGQAEAIVGPEPVVKYSLLAGEKALASYAWEEALAHFQRGLTAKRIPSEGTEPARDAEAAALLFGLAKARLSTTERYQIQGVADILGHVFEYYENVGDVPRALAVAEYRLPSTMGGRTAVSQYIPRALQLTAPDSPAAGRLLSNYGVELGRLESDYEGAQDAFTRAQAVARRLGDVALEVRTLAMWANVDLFHLHIQEALEKAEQAIDLAHRLSDPPDVWSVHLDAFRALLFTGESERAQHHASAALDLAGKLRTRDRLAQALGANAMLLARQGNWLRARDFSDRGLAVAPQDGLLLKERTSLEYEVGDFTRGKAYLERLLETLVPVPRRPTAIHANLAMLVPHIARITGVLDRLDLAAEMARRVLAFPLINPLFALLARAGLGMQAVLRHDAAQAAEHYATLDKMSGSYLTFAVDSRDRHLGLLCHTIGNLDLAAQHFDDGLAFCHKAGYRPLYAWTCCDCADTLLTRNQEGDRQRAMSLLDESLAISRELGMRPLMERTLSRREILKA